MASFSLLWKNISKLKTIEQKNLKLYSFQIFLWYLFILKTGVRRGRTVHSPTQFSVLLSLLLTDLPFCEFNPNHPIQKRMYKLSSIYGFYTWQLTTLPSHFSVVPSLLLTCTYPYVNIIQNKLLLISFLSYLRLTWLLTILPETTIILTNFFYLLLTDLTHYSAIHDLSSTSLFY